MTEPALLPDTIVTIERLRRLVIGRDLMEHMVSVGITIHRTDDGLSVIIACPTVEAVDADSAKHLASRISEAVLKGLSSLAVPSDRAERAEARAERAETLLRECLEKFTTMAE